MLMRKTIRHPLWEQPELFQPTPQRPTWKNLPKEVCQKALQLLAQLVRPVHDPDGAAGKEVGDE
jgi:hypothetical protein